jgi:hypothetical protein
MTTPDATDIDREAITRTTAELLAAVNTSDATDSALRSPRPAVTVLATSRSSASRTQQPSSEETNRQSTTSAKACTCIAASQIDR